MAKISTQQFRDEIAHAYTLCREGRFLDLSTMQLAHSTLVEDCFVDPLLISNDMRGRVAMSLLCWATDQLKPDDNHNWVSHKWRFYNTLHYFYIKGESMAFLAQKMAVARQTLYPVRDEALDMVVQILEGERQLPQNQADRIHYAVIDQYQRHTQDARTLLRILAAFKTAMPASLLFELARPNGVANPENSLQHLVATCWVLSNDDRTEYLLHPTLDSIIRTELSPKERRKWHRLIADHYLQKERYLDAVEHFRLATLHQRAVNVILTHQTDMINNMQVRELAEQIASFQSADIDENRWAELKIVEGDISHLIGDPDIALTAYREALKAPNPATKALAYYHCGMLLRRKNLNESLAYLARGIELLAAEQSDELLATIHITRACILIEDKGILESAESDLNCADQLITDTHDQNWIDLQNAWFILARRKQDWDTATKHGYASWLAATESGDTERMLKLGHNLGSLYAQLGQIDDALYYLEQSRVIAAESQNLDMLALTLKTLGATYFMQNDYDQAIEKYEASLLICQDIQNVNLIVHLHYDLVEVYGIKAEHKKMARHFGAGTQLATTLNLPRMIDAFKKLGERYYVDSPSLNPRQWLALNWLEKHESISNREYQTLNDVSPRQTARDLTKMEALNLIVKVGKGRSTVYKLSN